MTAAAFGNFDNDLTIFLHVFMKKGYICQKFKSAIWNMHGKNEFFCGITIWKNVLCLCMMNIKDIKIG